MLSLIGFIALAQPAHADTMAWSWPSEGALMTMEGTLRFSEPLPLTESEYAPMVDAVTVVTRTHCAPEGKTLLCTVQDARLKAVTSPAYWSDADEVLQEIQASLEGSVATLKVESSGRVRRVRGLELEGDGQTRALHKALASTLFWSLDLSLPASADSSWSQKDNLLDLPVALEHTRAGAIERGESVDISGDGGSRTVNGSYTFDAKRGLLMDCELTAIATDDTRSLVSTSAFEIVPEAWESRLSFIKVGAAVEKLP